jgi:hypothetical protein
MKILCSLSGVEFTCEHFPGTFFSRETFHPIFNLSQKRLLSYTGKWAGGELTRTDSYLLFLAILRSSDQIEFRVPAFRSEQTDSIIAINMEPLVRTVIKLNSVTAPSVVFPRFVISPETKTLQNVHHWIESWQSAYQDFLDGYKSAHESRKLIIRETALQRMIKNPHKAISEYAGQIAEWAALAGEFPQFLIQSPYNNLKITCAEFWKSIIVRCARDEYLYQIPAPDLQELIEHCEDKIPVGSIYSNALFKLLRHAQDRQKNFLGLGDIDVRSTYTLLDDSVTVEAANMRALIDSAPQELPRPEQYPNKFKYLQAKLKWDMAQKHGRNSVEGTSE